MMFPWATYGPKFLGCASVCIEMLLVVPDSKIRRQSKAEKAIKMKTISMVGDASHPDGTRLSFTSIRRCALETQLVPPVACGADVPPNATCKESELTERKAPGI